MTADFIGHHAAVAALHAHLPPVTLITGPPSVGKWTLGQHLAAYYQVGLVDQAEYPDGLDTDAARGLVCFVSTAPFGAFKLARVRLDGSSDAALNILLKTLEDPPGNARFILTAAGTVLPTIASRASRIHLGLLKLDEVRDILIARGMSPAAASRAAPLGRGQVRRAMSAAGGGEGPRAVVLGIVRALAAGDAEQYERAFRSFDDETRDLLYAWVYEAASGQWAAFTEADTFGLPRQRVRSMLFALSLLSRAGSRLGVRAALEPFLTPA